MTISFKLVFFLQIFIITMLINIRLFYYLYAFIITLYSLSRVLKKKKIILVCVCARAETSAATQHACKCAF